MKRLKKLAAIVSAGVLCLALASCGHLVPSANLEVNPANGSGKANFTISVPKNGVEGVGNNFMVEGDTENANKGYIKSPEALLTLFKSKVPSGFTVTMKEQTKMEEVENKETGKTETKDLGSYDYTVTFSFSSIADYNAKIKKWMPAKYWDAAKAYIGATDDIKEAAMTATGEAAAADVTLTVDTRILEVLGQWAFDVASTDTTGAVIDGGDGWDYKYVYDMDQSTFAIKFGGKDTAEKYNSAKSALTVKATGVDTSATSPSTGDPLAVSAVVVTVLAGGALLLLKKRK